MASINYTKILLVVAVGTVALIVFGTFFGVAWINSNPGHYSYTITTEGLSQYEGGPATEIIVPLPMRDGEPVFSKEELENRQFGSWRTALVETPHGTMLAFRPDGGNLTDIGATFSRRYAPGELRITDIRKESLSPLTCDHCDGPATWTNGTPDVPAYSSVIVLTDDLAPLGPDAPDIVIDIDAGVSEGLNHSILGDTYRVRVHENIPPDIRGAVNLSVAITQYSDGDWVPLN